MRGNPTTNTEIDPQEGAELTCQQERALIALLSLSSVKAAAQAAKVSEATLWRWLQQTPFKARHREMRKQATGAAISRLQMTMGDAADTLHSIATDFSAPPAARVAAARALLDNGLRATAIDDLGAELEELERAAADAMRQSQRN